VVGRSGLCLCTGLVPDPVMCKKSTDLLSRSSFRSFADPMPLIFSAESSIFAAKVRASVHMEN
jgi:hypothetical protein